MDKKNLLLIYIFIPLTLAGCQHYAIATKIDATSVPDQTYDVTIFKGSRPLSYAVLFDIPDDGKPVVMYHTYLNERIGKDSPRKYIDYFKNRIRGYRTLKVSERDGTVRAYLMVSNFLHYRIYERPVGERFIVMVGDPFFGPVLHGRGR